MDWPQLPVSWSLQLFTKGLTSVKFACISQDKLRTSTCSHTIMPAHKDSDVTHFPIPVLLKKHFIFGCIFRRLTRGSWMHQSKVILFIYNKCFWLHSVWPFRQHFIKKLGKNLMFFRTTSHNPRSWSTLHSAICRKFTGHEMKHRFQLSGNLKSTRKPPSSWDGVISSKCNQLWKQWEVHCSTRIENMYP